MPVLSIIACGMLEDELAHVLSRDCEIKQLIVVESRYNFGFLRKLRSGNCVFWTVPLDRVQMLLKDEFSPDFNKNVQKFSSTFCMKITDLKGSYDINDL